MKKRAFRSAVIEEVPDSGTFYRQERTIRSPRFSFPLKGNLLFEELCLNVRKLKN